MAIKYYRTLSKAASFTGKQIRSQGQSARRKKGFAKVKSYLSSQVKKYKKRKYQFSLKNKKKYKSLSGMTDKVYVKNVFTGGGRYITRATARIQSRSKKLSKNKVYQYGV